MEKLYLNAYAKLNLTLDIVGKRADGYHLINSVMQSVDLADRIEISLADSVSVYFANMALDSTDNTAYKAARLFFSATSIWGGCKIIIAKGIPSGAGMGGASADAAAVLHGLNELYQTKLPTATLIRLGERIGADVPFCLMGGTAKVGGIGERVEPISPFPKCFFVAVKPHRSVNTAEAYQQLDTLDTLPEVATDQCIEAIEKGEAIEAAKYFGNVFEAVTDIPEIADIKTALRLYGGVNPIMTGSGSVIFSLFIDEEKAKECYFRLCELGMKCYIFSPCREGYGKIL